MRVAFLFDGAGLARLGFERAGHVCQGVELNPVVHHLGQSLAYGPCVLADVRSQEAEKVIMWAEAVWASPPCQWRSDARTQGPAQGDYAEDLLEWSLGLQDRYPHLKYLWVENIRKQGNKGNDWGCMFNAAQWQEARQNRQRIVGGVYPMPETDYQFRTYYPVRDLPPCITGSEYKGCATDTRRASRYYGRKLTIRECAYAMGLDDVPYAWAQVPEWFAGTESDWKKEQYTALGNGVPVWMAEKFGQAARQKQLSLFKAA